MITSIFLTVLATLCGTQEITRAKKIEIEKYRVVEAIRESADHYDNMNIFSKTDEVFENKKQLLSFYENNDLLPADYLQAFKDVIQKAEDARKPRSSARGGRGGATTIVSSSSTTTASVVTLKDTLSKTSLVSYDNYLGRIERTGYNYEIDNCVLKAINSNSNNNSGKLTGSSERIPLATGEYIYEYSTNSYTGPATNCSDSNDNSNMNNSQKIEENPFYLLDTYSYNESNVNTNLNGKVEGYSFVGIKASKDACIALYNSVLGFLKGNEFSWGLKQYLQAMGGAGVLLTSLYSLTSMSAATVVTSSIAIIVTKLSAFFSGIWSSICAFFNAFPVIGTIIAVVLAVAGLACIVAITTMFICGYFKRGFALGFKVKSLFDWEWFCGLTD